MKTSHIELLAPAGSFSSLNAALKAGADCVYLGVAEFNMRASAAKNFTLDNLDEVMKLCKEHEVKCFVTVNTLLYNEELEIMRKIVDRCKEVQVDAIIAADMATIQYASKIGVHVQISTQLSISNTQSLKYYSQFADRVVLARELSLDQIKKIAEDIKRDEIRGPNGELVELEVFAHGALCAAVSGRCAMSLHFHDLSANRGKCSHVCRRSFRVIDLDTKKELEIDNNYIMSSSDLCTIGMLPEIIDTGAKVLKIEGRGRSAEYVDLVVSIYRKALQAIEDGNYNDDLIEEWNKKLKTVYNRGQSEGLYRGKTFAEWAGTDGSRATEVKTLVGKVKKYYPKAKVLEFVVKVDDKVRNGAKYLIIGDNTGVVKGKMNDIHVDCPEDETGSVSVKKAQKGDLITFKISEGVRKGDKVYIVRKRDPLEIR